VIYRSHVDKDLQSKVEQSGVPGKLTAYHPIAVAGRSPSMLGGVMPIASGMLQRLSQVDRIGEALRIRGECAGRWDATHEYLYRCLIRALDLWDYEDMLLQMAKPKRGRKAENDLAESIWALHEKGKTASEIETLLATCGKNMSIEAIESYLKTRRKKPNK
jgi:hypothetical protein